MNKIYIFFAIKGKDLDKSELITCVKENLQDELNLLEKSGAAGFTATDIFKRTLNNCLELVDQIVNNNVTNGVGFIDSQFSTDITTLLIKFCVQKYNLKRILIINWDIEHNTKLQEKFYENSSVLNVSIHRYDGESNSDFFNIGGNNAKGFNVNIPLNEVRILIVA